jgi:hypothetical protein
MPEPARGLLDTSVVLDHDIIDIELLPDESGEPPEAGWRTC